MHDSDLKEIHALLFSAERNERANGQAMVDVMRKKGNISVGLDSTAALIAVQDLESDHSDVADHSIQSAYSLALIRAVNGLVDREQRSTFRTSLKTLAARIHLPYSLVDVRHEATHQQLPPLPALRQSALLMLDWLRHNYWGPTLRVSHAEMVTSCTGELQGFFTASRPIETFIDELVRSGDIVALPGALVESIYLTNRTPDLLEASSNGGELIRRALDGLLGPSFLGSILGPFFARIFSDVVRKCYLTLKLLYPDEKQVMTLGLSWLDALLGYAEKRQGSAGLLTIIREALLLVISQMDDQYIFLLEEVYSAGKSRLHNQLTVSDEFTMKKTLLLDEDDVGTMVPEPSRARCDTELLPSHTLARLLHDMSQKFSLGAQALDSIIGLDVSTQTTIVHRLSLKTSLGATTLTGTLWSDNAEVRAYYYGGLRSIPRPTDPE
ncbi:Las1-like protein [Giardia muris]|uniref:Las1-like protein n=1 Tax=Giardia muris TaxID=5742 RepID=A0A4Z1SN23_GIAMU|nr:Las1-like protein [Giardia muris]|eukprot:TNJ26990.1 Las1-like protein [Giardia muris]